MRSQSRRNQQFGDLFHVAGQFGAGAFKCDFAAIQYHRTLSYLQSQARRLLDQDDGERFIRYQFFQNNQ